MQITSVSYKNLKGATLSHDLAPVTMVSGLNFAGKSRLLEALALACCGRLAGVPETNAGVYEWLASGNPLAVQVEFKDGVFKSVGRQWEADRKGAVKYTGPDGELFPEVALDPAKFFGLSGPERAKFLFARATLPAELARQKLAEVATANLKNVKLEDGGNTPETEAVVAELVGLVMASVAEKPALSVQGWLADICEQVRQRKLLSDQNVKRLQSTQQGLAQVGTQDAPPDQSAEAREREAREALDVASRAADKLEAELNSLRKDWEEANGKAKAGRVDTAALSAEAARLGLELAEIDKLPHPDAAPKKLKPGVPWTASACRVAWEKALADANKAGNERDTAKAELTRLNQELAETEDAKVCSKCGQKLAKLRDAALAKLRDQIKSQTITATAAEKAADVKDAELKRAATASAEARERESVYNKAIDRKAEVNGRLAQIASALQAAGGASEAAARLPELERKGAELKVAHENAAAAREARRKELAGWSDEARRLVAWRSEAASKAKAKDRAELTKAEAAVLKLAAQGLGDMRDELTARAVGGLLARANELCGPLLECPLVFADGEVGLQRPGKVVKCRRPACSGTEEALAFAAMSLALAADSPVRIVVLDEVGRLDKERRVALALHVCAMQQAGIIDQAVLVGTEPVACVRPNYGEVRL